MSNEKNGRQGRPRKYLTLGDAIKPQVEIKALIEKQADVSLLTVSVQSGNDEPRVFRVGPINDGGQEGEDWEKAILVWTRAYRYIADNLNAAVIDMIHELAEEASIHAQTMLREIDLKQLCSTSVDLKRFHESMGTRYTAGKPYEDGEYFWHLMGWQAFHAERRLTGWELLKIGSPGTLRYSRVDIEQIAEEYPKCLDLWQTARNIQYEFNGKEGWQDEAKRQRGELNKPYHNDLFALLSEKYDGNEQRTYKWRPKEVAIIHAAQRAGVSQSHRHVTSSVPKTKKQARQLLDLMDDYLEEREAALKFGLRW